jgi:hypothetical protein
LRPPVPFFAKGNTHGRCELTTTFLAVYRGESVATARLLAVSSDPSLVARFAAELVSKDEVEEERESLRLVPEDNDE